MDNLSNNEIRHVLYLLQNDTQAEPECCQMRADINGKLKAILKTRQESDRPAISRIVNSNLDNAAREAFVAIPYLNFLELRSALIHSVYAYVNAFMFNDALNKLAANVKKP